MASLQSFEDLDVWQLARALRQQISELVKQFPEDEKYRLIDQILRSSRSVPANIAEGFGRYHYKDNAKFCYQARGSLVETMDHLICAHDEGYINDKELVEHKKLIQNCLKRLNGYISYLSNAKQITNNQ